MHSFDLAVQTEGSPVDGFLSRLSFLSLLYFVKGDQIFLLEGAFLNPALTAVLDTQ